MKTCTEPRDTQTLTDWPSLVEFKKSRCTEYDPSTDADAEEVEPAVVELDYILPP